MGNSVLLVSGDVRGVDRDLEQEVSGALEAEHHGVGQAGADRLPKSGEGDRVVAVLVRGADSGEAQPAPPSGCGLPG